MAIDNLIRESSVVTSLQFPTSWLALLNSLLLAETLLQFSIPWQYRHLSC
jgi:hypothetical protein